MQEGVGMRINLDGDFGFGNRSNVIDLPGLEERKNRLSSDSVIAQIQTGKKITIAPVDWEPGKACDIRVTVEGIAPRFASLRTRSKCFTCSQLMAVDTPSELIGEAVRDLLENFEKI